MPRTTVFEGSVERLEILGPDGVADPALRPPLSDEALAGLYTEMIRTRALDRRAVALQREGRMGTYASCLGQEAAQVGSARALEAGDWVIPSYRENGVFIARGVPMENVFIYWGGDERGMDGLRDRRCLPYAIPVGTQTLHAVGLAMALRLRREPAVAACYFGDGATSTGDVHEALTFAGVLEAPVVFLCQNNQWAISVPRERQCAAETLAQKALGYGIPGLQVDGNDVLACWVATREAADRARAGLGPTFLEAVTYRIDDHTTADDARRYRDAGEVEAWRARDPIRRMRVFLESEGLWDPAREDDLQREVAAEVDAAVARAEALPPADPAEIVEHLFANAPAATLRQLARVASASGTSETSGGDSPRPK